MPFQDPVVFEPMTGLALLYPQGELCTPQEEAEVSGIEAGKAGKMVKMLVSFTGFRVYGHRSIQIPKTFFVMVYLQHLLFGPLSSVGFV